jgi:exo-1,4-beta-D-glucosaminidase
MVNSLVCLSLTFAAARSAEAQTPAAVVLERGWQIQSSAKVPETGDAISSPAYRPSGWYATSAPATVLAALVENKLYPDPFVGMNLRSIPGTSYPIGRIFSSLPMPDDSPFRVAWWYRTSFAVPAAMRGQRLSLHFDGINYRANVWLNGRQIATSDQVAGTFRLYEFDVTDVAKTGEANTLAVEIFPPLPDDLAWTWVDWNPAPPDKNMGLWRPVSITASGDVTVRHPMVASRVVATSSSSRADLTVSTELHNLSLRAVQGTLRGRIEAIAFEKHIELAAGETRRIKFTPEEFAALHLTSPRLWWPAEMGTPNLYRLDLEFSQASVSDRASIRFGIREITSEVVATGGRQFFVNGHPILIRGGGWAPDMLMRASPERQDAEMRYVRDLHLNTIRLEGKLEDEHFFDLADQYGILVLAGWCCCDQWEKWSAWKPEHHAIASASQHDQICRLRSHPSMLAWLNGSDNPPPPAVEQVYVDILKALDWPNPYVSSATARRTTVTGATGVKMTGPYDWVPPSYWLIDSTRGGAAGFNTETSPGPAVPPIESLRAMLPADHLWPIDDVWNYHAGGGSFKDIQIFTKAQNARYGEARGIEEFSAKAQVMTYEAERAMFEGYARNAPVSTGVIQWMLNNAWPSMIWHLYDYYLRPGGGYFGTKKACEPVHVQYSYDDRSVVALNGSTLPIAGATVVARVVNLDMTEKFSDTRKIDLPPGSHPRVLTIPEVPGLSSTYFVDLRLRDGKGQAISSNLYWLSSKSDDMDFPKSNYFVTPVKAYADLTALNDLPAAPVTSSVRLAASKDEPGREEVRVTLANPGKTLAFFIRLQIKRESGEEVLPVLWDDNFISLLPGETREIRASYRTADRGAARPLVVLSGWNVKGATIRP